MGDKWVKSEERARADTTAPGITVPLDNNFFAEVITEASGGNNVRFEFSAGDFDFVLIKKTDDDSVIRHEGKIKDRSISGLTDASITLQPGGLNFLLTWLDADGGQDEYTFRLSRGQLMPWTNKKHTT